MRTLCCGLFLICAVLRAEPVLIVSSEFVPHNGEHLPQQGYAIELVRQIFASQQQQIQIEFLPWPRALKQVQQGQAAAIVTLWYDSDRARYLNYPSPLYSNAIRFYQRKDKPIQFQQLAELAKQQLRLGMVRGYSYHPAVRALPFEFVEVNSDLESLKMLALGRVDLVIAEQMVAEYLLQHELQSYQQQISSTGPLLETKPMYLAFAKHHPAAAALQLKFEQGLQQLKTERRLQSLIPRY